MSALAQYRAVLDLSRQMVDLSQRQSWDELASLETRRAQLLGQMPADLSSLPAGEQAAIAATIRQIQDCDDSVLAYVMPWREHAGALLSRLQPGR